MEWHKAFRVCVSSRAMSNSDPKSARSAGGTVSLPIHCNLEEPYPVCKVMAQYNIFLS